jgi:outer membrane protein OmpA-like peptidoglycan-associated protein
MMKKILTHWSMPGTNFRRMQAAHARTATLEAQLADLSARSKERGVMNTLGDVLLGKDLSHVNSAGMQKAQELAAVLKQNRPGTVLIEGLTASAGSVARNQDLSEKSRLEGHGRGR